MRLLGVVLAVSEASKSTRFFSRVQLLSLLFLKCPILIALLLSEEGGGVLAASDASASAQFCARVSSSRFNRLLSWSQFYFFGLK